jgi:hypothetical protein
MKATETDLKRVMSHPYQQFMGSDQIRMPMKEKNCNVE